MFDGVDVGEFTFDSRGRSASDMGWTLKGILLRASGNQTYLEFMSLDDGCSGPAIDDIRFYPAQQP